MSEKVLDRELLFLLKSQCIVAEHLRTDALDDDDLIRLAPAGFVHLESLEMVSYLAAIAEDTWYTDFNVADEIAQRIGSKGHYTYKTELKNARDLVDYLVEQRSKTFPAPQIFLNDSALGEILDLSKCVTELETAERSQANKHPWVLVEDRYEIGKEYSGIIVNRVDYGLFIELEPGVTGLAHRTNLSRDFLENDDYLPGEKLEVSILKIDVQTKRIALGVLQQL